jgi:hypothetical protein
MARNCHFAAIFRLSLVFLALGVGACSFPQSQRTRLFKQWTAKCKAAAELLETVKDIPSAQAASPKIIALMKELDKLDAQIEAVQDREDVDLIDMPRETKQVGEGIGQMQRLMTESVRIGKDRELRAALGDAWNYLPAAMMLDEEGNFREE